MTLAGRLAWALDVVRCQLTKHRYDRAKVFRSKSLHNGWQCQRCGRTKLLLRPWDNKVAEE